jgi:UDP-2-acetamido-3-amino-2,3-dideoxy-glucuronate N-acetyltransferase
MIFYAHPSAVVDEGAVIGADTKIWHFSHIMAGAVIGSQCIIGQNVFVSDGAKLGNNVKVQNNVSIYSGVTCEDDVFIGPSVVFTNVINPRSFVSRKNEYKETRVSTGATIGANATIICGNKIGEFSFIAAASVVTKDVLPYSIVKGNPARAAGWISEYGNVLHFDNDMIAICAESNQRYLLQNAKVSKIN